ncbi:MAG: hypothetical protein VB997_00895 [Opitutales bacterium]
MSPEEETFSEAIEAYETLLHSETQAIVAADLDKLEAILEAKDETLQAVLSAREGMGSDPRENPMLNKMLDHVLEIQARNAQTLDNLVATHSKEKEETVEGANRLRKVRDAYFSHFGSDGRRFEV